MYYRLHCTVSHADSCNVMCMCSVMCCWQLFVVVPGSCRVCSMFFSQHTAGFAQPEAAHAQIGAEKVPVT